MQRLALSIGLGLMVMGNAWALKPGSQTVSFNIGGAVPLSNVDVTEAGGGSERPGKAGASFGGQYLYQTAPQFSMGADVNYSMFGDKTSSTFIPGGDSTLSSKALVLLAIGKMSLVTEGKVLPYLLGGLGVHNSSLKIDARPSPGFIWADTGTTETRSELDDSATGFAAAIGAGLDFPVSEYIILGLEVRYQYLGKATYNATPAAERDFGVSAVKGSASMVNILAHVGYKF